MARLAAAAVVGILTACLSHVGNAYVAAVLESSPNQTVVSTVEEAVARMMGSLELYAPYVSTASQAGAEIMVFNEMGVSGFSFNTALQVHPFLFSLPVAGTPLCDAALAANPASTAAVLAHMGCMAAHSNITLVFDIPERRKCTPAFPCPSKGWFQFNTQVAIVGGSGALASAYVKNHLYLPGGEGKIFDVAPWAPSHVTFQSHTGRVFGQAVCFDAFFPNPILALGAEGVRHIVFSSYWENLGSYPIIAAQPLQRAVSETAGVNFMGTSVGYSWQHSGSGLYASGHIVNATYSTASSPTTTLLLGELPDDPLPPPATALPALPPASSAQGPMALEVVGTSPGPLTLRRQVQHGGITCDFNVTLQVQDVGGIGLIAQDGEYMVGAMRSQLCSLQVCPLGQCGMGDLPIPSAQGVSLLSGSITMSGFTAGAGHTIASGPQGAPSQPVWDTVTSSGSGGQVGVVGTGRWDVTTVTLFGAFPSL